MEDSRSPSPSLDFLSSEFDPVRVLSASPSRVQLPCPSVQACDNLDAYQSVVQGTRRQWVEPVGGVKKEVGGAVAEEISQSVQPKQKLSTVLQFMKNPQLETFSVLQHCHGNQERVRVWIRHCAGVRGVCEGVLLAFDKHLNLVLGDVEEEYTPFRTLANGGRAKKRRKKQRKGRVESNPLTATAATRESGEEPSSPASSVMPPAGEPSSPASSVMPPAGEPYSPASFVMPPAGEPSSPASFVMPPAGGATSSNECSLTAVSSEKKTVGAGAAAGKPRGPANPPARLSRHVGKLFIRGDNIVLVAPVQPTTPH